MLKWADKIKWTDATKNNEFLKDGLYESNGQLYRVKFLIPGRLALHPSLTSPKLISVSNVRRHEDAVVHHGSWVWIRN